MRLGYLADNILAPFAPPNIVSNVVQASQTLIDNPSSIFFSIVDPSLLSSQQDKEDREKKDRKYEEERRKQYVEDEEGQNSLRKMFLRDAYILKTCLIPKKRLIRTGISRSKRTLLRNVANMVMYFIVLLINFLM